MAVPRLLRDFRYWFFYRILIKRGVPLITLGDVNQWTFHDNGFNSGSRVLCAGAGHDISFESALIARFDCPVVLLDPSPTGVATVQSEVISPGRLRFVEAGLAATDGIMSFEDPLEQTEGSFRETVCGAAGKWQFACKSISTLMREFDWPEIDLLKVDIEGFEYGVIDDVLNKGLPIRQICVEFHFGVGFGHTRREMIRQILALRRAGYDLVHQFQRDHTFLRRSVKQ